MIIRESPIVLKQPSYTVLLDGSITSTSLKYFDYLLGIDCVEMTLDFRKTDKSFVCKLNYVAVMLT